MTRAWCVWTCVRVPFVSLCVTVAGLLLWQASGATQGQAPEKPNPPATPPHVASLASLLSALDDAIRQVEAGEFATFLERYAPVEMLRELRRKNLVERAAAVLAERPQTKVQLLALLRTLRKQTPQFDKSEGLAALQFDPAALEPPESVGELHIPSTAGLKLTGLGGDPPRVLGEAIRLLEAGDISTFVDRLFPATEIARLQEFGQMQALQQQFEDTPELTAALLADLKRMQSVQPALSGDGLVASFPLAAENGQPARTIKLQKVGRDWRLFDDAPRVATEITRQAQFKSSDLTTVELERVGGKWRFIELPLLQMNLK